jgi:Cof subfamily protein (haloacid dehalogenase superfamily)
VAQVTASPYKLLVVDIDGTLLGRDGTISAEDTEAVARVRRSGIPVSLSTGRVAQACFGILDQLSLDGYHIFADGALVYNPRTGEEVYSEPVSPDLVRQITEFAHREEIPFDLYSVSHFYVERRTWATDIRQKFFGLTPTVIDFTDLWRNERIIKGTLVVRSPEEKARASDFYQHFKDRLHLSWTNTPAFPDVDFINVISPGVSKGKALEALTSFLKVPLPQVMAIGDGANDAPVLSRSGLAVAMGNAPESLKAVAGHVTLDVEHNGVAAAINKFLL